uniref:Uncharacterized protein n=1 Tax=Balaenoptera musculus TaxID=9771 RepID=A0A8C0D7V9_BALMU
MTTTPDPFPTPLHPSYCGWRRGRRGEWGSRPLRSGHRQRTQIWTKSGQCHPSPTATAMPAGRTTEIQTTTPAKPSKWRY